jgi:WD40 repeat protein
MKSSPLVVFSQFFMYTHRVGSYFFLLACGLSGTSSVASLTVVRKSFAGKEKGELLMTAQSAFSPRGSAPGLFLSQQMIPRRAVLRQLVGCALAGGSILPLATACGQAPSPSAPTSHAQGTLLYSYVGHTTGVLSVAWSPDGKRIASGSGDQTVQVWDAATGAHPYTYHGHAGNVNAVAWSPDGQRIASAGADGTVQVWDVIDGGQVYTYRGHTLDVDAVAWSPDGQRIASASEDTTATF